MKTVSYALCAGQMFIGYVFHVGGNVPIAALFYGLGFLMAVENAANRIIAALEPPQ